MIIKAFAVCEFRRTLWLSPAALVQAHAYIVRGSIAFVHLFGETVDHFQIFAAEFDVLIMQVTGGKAHCAIEQCMRQFYRLFADNTAAAVEEHKFPFNNHQHKRWWREVSKPNV